MGRVDARILKLMGDAHFLQKDFDRAAERYRQALRLRPDYVEAHNNLAATCEEQGKLEEALCHFNEAAKTSPDASAYCTIARILVLMDRKAEAVRNLHKALEMNPAPDLAEKIRGQLEGLEKSPPASGP
jgi:tetratricopeptide (TPR) repeat protein